MKLKEFDYHLPPELIAQTPIEPRDHSRLMIVDRKTWDIRDKYFYNLLDELSENDVLVVNQTRVINARLHGTIKSSLSTEEWGDELLKRVEIFLHKQISQNSWDCLVYPWKKLKPGKKISFTIHSPNKKEFEDVVLTATIKEISEKGRIVEFNKWWVEFLEIVEKLWETPLPPYIKEKLENSDRYQTVYNKTSGSVAAPTAWLHFTPELLEKLEKKWVKIEKVLLHVWLWTFAWVETEKIEDHSMHSEYIELEEDVAKRLNKYKNEWKKIVAVWTTSNRVLESFSDDTWFLSHGCKDTDIFIYPWYKWKFIDWIITNFHLPKSTLIMLVSSFAGQENIKKAYSHAISNKYRFFSFWDAMLIR